MLRPFIFFFILSALYLGCSSRQQEKKASSAAQKSGQSLLIVRDSLAGTISVFREGSDDTLLTQHAREDFRPYLHPIHAPDGNGRLTQYSPAHHKHQTGLYWGFTRVNGRDYFHHPEGDYWRRVAAEVLHEQGREVSWRTEYELLDEAGEVVLTEIQQWTMQEQDGKYLLSLDWKGTAQQDVTIGKYDYGGLFLRMPWFEGIQGEVVNAARQRNEKAEGQRAMWLDVGMQVEGRDDLAHIAIFDHPDNKGFPQPWRVDGQFGVGPVRARLEDWHIPRGETEVIRHQLVVYTGKLNDLELTKLWEDFSGNHSTYSTASLWAIAQKEGREAAFLTAEQAVDSMTLTDGFKVNVWASEPMMTQPMAFCWDDKGRLWIAENRDYESRGHGFSSAGDSRILILEDTDHDGIADSRKVFLEGLAFPAAIAVGFDGVFVGAPPNLLFVPDRDHDDKADVNDIEVRLTGWGIRDRHETLNSLHWGPDGWLYGLQGFATPSKVRKPQGRGRLYRHNEPFPEDILEGEGVEINGGVWRYHPLKDRFEVVAHGFSNPWGIDYDAKGQLFISACVIPHLWHVVPGGVYHRQGGQHFNPYVYDDLKTIADHRHRSAHGGARIYQSDAFPESQQGRIFMANIHEHAVLSDVLQPKGSGFTAYHGDDVLMANNAQWVGFSMEIGPDGALYVLDWHDADICGQEVLNQETGRIFRISPQVSGAKTFKGRYGDLSDMTDRQLAELQNSSSDWHARRARVILQHRSAKGSMDKGALQHLLEMFRHQDNADWRLRAMWALHVTGSLSESMLLQSLEDQDEYVRAWAIQMLNEDKLPEKALQKMGTMARKDPSAVVRLYLASALQRLDLHDRWEIAAGLLQHAEDIQDHNLPKMIWFGVEPLVAHQADRALELAANSKIPLLSRFIARRAVDANALEALVKALGGANSNQVSMLEGMRDGMEGRTELQAPPQWRQVYEKLQQADDNIARIALEVSQLFGDAEAARQFLSTLSDKQAPVEQRRTALQRLAGQQREELLENIPALLQEPTLRRDAIRAVASFEKEELGAMLLKQYPRYNRQDKAEVIQALASRPVYGWQLTQALKKQTIEKRDVPAYIARQLRRVVGSGFVEVWGPIDELPAAETVREYKRYIKLLQAESIQKADLKKGRSIFLSTCGPCHTMYGEGGDLGPDITGSNRTNLEYLLSNILDPSGEIQEAYQMVVITTRDGRTYTGNVAAETERQLRLKVVGQPDALIAKSDIQSRETMPASMMPQGLLKTLSDEEVIDLVAYLQSAEQVAMSDK